MRIYKAELLDDVEKAVEAAPAMELRFYSQEQMLARLGGKIRDLYLAKNYEPRDIVAFLKNEGVKVTQREVKAMLADLLKPSRRARNIIAKN